MRYSGSLAKEEREKIFGLFLESPKMRFNQIEKALKIRSNKLAYHLEMMQKEGLIQKKGFDYNLSEKGEKYIPIFSHITGTELSPLPVILVAIVNKNKILMIKRNKRPYKNYWSLIGGKMLLGEDFKEASLRLVKEKTNLNGSFASYNAVLHERVSGYKGVKYAFILFFTKVITKDIKFRESNHGNLRWIGSLKKEKIIPSDRWLIINKLNSRIRITNALMRDREGELSEFRISG